MLYFSILTHIWVFKKIVSKMLEKENRRKNKKKKNEEKLEKKANKLFLFISSYHSLIFFSFFYLFI